MTAGLDPLLALGVRLALALLLAVAAAHKLGDRARFAGLIDPTQPNFNVVTP